MVCNVENDIRDNTTGIGLLILFTMCFSLAFIACHETLPGIFVDVTHEAGIDFKYNFGDTTYDNILESSGSGVTIFDYDHDGDQDLYLLNGTYLEGISDISGKGFEGTPNKLYRNNGDGTFTEEGHLAGIDDRHWSMAASAVDYDGDGDLDLYLLNYGPNVFYQNNGDGTFRDVTVRKGFARAGIAQWIY